jgi:hypothetical protein
MGCSGLLRTRRLSVTARTASDRAHKSDTKRGSLASAGFPLSTPEPTTNIHPAHNRQYGRSTEGVHERNLTGHPCRSGQILVELALDLGDLSILVVPFQTSRPSGRGSDRGPFRVVGMRDVAGPGARVYGGHAGDPSVARQG